MLIYPGTCYTRSGTTLVLRAHQQPYSQTVQSYNMYCVLLCFCLLLGWAWVSLVPRRGTRLSLSEPHTSVTALHINLYVYVCLLGPTNMKWVYLQYLMKIECLWPRALQLSLRARVKCKVLVWRRPGASTTQIQSMYGNLLYHDKQGRLLRSQWQTLSTVIKISVIRVVHAYAHQRLSLWFCYNMYPLPL